MEKDSLKNEITLVSLSKMLYDKTDGIFNRAMMR